MVQISPLLPTFPLGSDYSVVNSARELSRADVAVRYISIPLTGCLSCLLFHLEPPLLFSLEAAPRPRSLEGLGER